MVKRGVSQKFFLAPYKPKPNLREGNPPKWGVYYWILLVNEHFQGRYFVIPGLDLTIMISHNE